MVSVERLLLRDHSTIRPLGFAKKILRDLFILLTMTQEAGLDSSILTIMGGSMLENQSMHRNSLGYCLVGAMKVLDWCTQSLRLCWYLDSPHQSSRHLVGPGG